MATLDIETTRPAGSSHADGKAYFETSTNKFIVWDATHSEWIELNSDGTGGYAYENRWGASFDGSQYLNVPVSTDFSFGTSDFSFGAWFNPDVVSGYRAIIDFRQLNGNKLPSLYNSPTSGYKLYVWTGSARVANYNTTLTTGQWYHVIYTRSGTTGTIYLNGTSVATGTDGTNYSMSGTPYLGAPAPGVAGSRFIGKIDDVAVWNTALSVDDIEKMYDGTAPNGKPTDLTLRASYDTDRTSNLVGYWRMGDDSNDTATSGGSIATITDSSGSGNGAAQSDVTKQPTFADLTGETIYA